MKLRASLVVAVGVLGLVGYQMTQKSDQKTQKTETTSRGPAFSSAPTNRGGRGGSGPGSTGPRQDAQVHIVATTDVHGYLQAQPATSAASALPIGGIDVMQGYFNIVKAQDPNTLFVDSGDLFQGTIISNTTEGATVVKWMNSAGYLATAIGNHDFDFGPGGGTDIVTRPGQDPLGALKAREAQANFKFLSANICSLDEDPGRCSDVATFRPASISTPYILKTVNGVNLAVIGITTTSTPETTLPQNVARLKFMSMSATLDRYVPMLKAQGADGVVVLMHEGGFCNKGTCSPSDPLFIAIDAMKSDTRSQITLILAGHTHNYVNTTYNGVRTMINGRYGASFGYVTLNFSASDGSLQVSDSKSYDFCPQVYPSSKNCSKGTGTPETATFLGQTVVPDPKATALIADDLQKANAQAAQIIGTLVTKLTKSTSGQESSLGEMMADAFRNCGDSTCTNPVDIAFQNDGGIRTNQISAGQVTYGEIFQLDPFEDYYSLLSLTGAQVHDLIDGWWDYGHGTLPQVSGIKIAYDPNAGGTRTITNAAGESKTVKDIVVSVTMADGALMDEAKTYQVVMTDFLASGGGGTDTVVKGLSPKVTYSRILRDCMIDYFKANPNLDYSKMGGRLVQGSK